MCGKAAVFCSMVEDEQGLRQVELFIESLRKYGGVFSGSAVWVYFHPGLAGNARVSDRENVSVFQIPEVAEECRSYFFSNKVYCAAEAEERLADTGKVLVWVDEDTLVLNEPAACSLAAGKAAALCPVMHNRTGVAWDRQPGELWRYLDSLFNVEGDALFPVTAPADEVLIRPYFNAGFMVVDPRIRLMRTWKEAFVPLCRDSRVCEWVAEKPDDRIFLHQMVLTQVLLRDAGKDGIEVLATVYNYPLFFDELFPAVRAFNDLSEAVTARYDVYFREPRDGWQDRLKGPVEKTSWFAKRLSELTGSSA